MERECGDLPFGEYLNLPMTKAEKPPRKTAAALYFAEPSHYVILSKRSASKDLTVRFFDFAACSAASLRMTYGSD